MQESGGIRHAAGRLEAILRVLQRQSWETDWRALQQSEDGAVAGAPGTTKGAQTLRLLSWAGQLWPIAPPISCAWITSTVAVITSMDRDTAFEFAIGYITLIR